MNKQPKQQPFLCLSELSNGPLVPQKILKENHRLLKWYFHSYFRDRINIAKTVESFRSEN